MKPLQLSIIALCAFALITPAVVADENHEIIEKVMKDGMKNPKDSDGPMKKLLGGSLSKEDTAALVKLVKTMTGTKAPTGDQADFDKKVKEMIEALDVVGGGDTSEKAITRLEDAQNCKACHSDHKPKKKKG